MRPPTPAPPSLLNVYKCLKRDYPDFQPPPARGGLLTPWADRGVLLLNTCLTVRAHQPNSHANHGWERFTQRVLEVVAEKRKAGVVFLAWGSPAKKRCVGLGKGGRHCILESVHPSPLSAERGFVSVTYGLVTAQSADEKRSLIASTSSRPMNGSSSATARTVSSTGTSTLARRRPGFDSRVQRWLGVVVLCTYGRCNSEGVCFY